MRKIIVLVLLAAFVAMPVFAQQFKFGYVNSKEIMQLFREVRDLELSLEQDLRKWETEIEQKRKSLDSLKTAFSDQHLMLSDEETTARNQEIQNKKAEIDKMVSEIWGAGGKAEEQNKQLFKPLYEKIMTAIREIAQVEGYTYVFDIAEAGIVFAPLEDDITQKVINKLNEQIQRESTPEELERIRLEEEEKLRREQEQHQPRTQPDQ